MQKNVATAKVTIVGLAKIFSGPYVYYDPETRKLTLVTKECFSTAEQVSGWAEVHWENRSWRRKKCVGFEIFVPPGMSVREGDRVTEVLERVALLADKREFSKPFGDYRNLFYQLTISLRIYFPK